MTATTITELLPSMKDQWNTLCIMQNTNNHGKVAHALELLIFHNAFSWLTKHVSYSMSDLYFDISDVVETRLV